ncbi:discoidin domain-containing protein [Kitasatospora sp. NPDC059327]|uniref:discoidin domain-containing protein n=1 Tax=Kitasatospora sp. NPDC059327 TaxID=3346803 RepID=UPI0036B3A547
MRLPYNDNFDSYALRRTPKYLAELGGTLETAQCGGGRTGICLRSTMTEHPLYWHGLEQAPAAVIGDTRWNNYTASTDINFETSGVEVTLGVRDTNHSGGIRLAVQQSGAWQIRTASGTVLASGTRETFPMNSWHSVSVSAEGSTIIASIDGVRLGPPVTVPSDTATAGQVSLAVSNYSNVQFDNFTVQPGTGVVVAAESSDSEVVNYAAGTAIDGDPSTMWQSQFTPTPVPGPHYITLELSQAQPVSCLGYLPRQDSVPNGRILSYAVSTSIDGVNFAQVTNGTWANSATAKAASFPASQAKYVRLTSLAGSGGFASAAEITIR